MGLSVNNEQLFTEELVYYELEGETLKPLEGPLTIFFSSRCYVLEWHYRLERTAKQLDGTPSRHQGHDTGILHA